MKPLRLLLASVCFLLPVTFIFGQGNKDIKFDFFAKGKNSYTLRETGYYGQLNSFENGQKTGSSNSTYIDVEWNHWLGKGLGAGLNIYSNWSGSHFNNNDDLSRYWTISPNVSYGKTLSNRWGVYGRVDLSFGLDKDIYKTPAMTTTDKANLFGYGATVAFPYRISKYTALTTSLSYDNLESKFDNSKETDKSFGVGFSLEDYLFCNQMKCDHKTGFKLSQGVYDRGSVFINPDSYGSINFGDNEQAYNVGPTTYTTKYNYNTIDLDVNAWYYLVDHLAIGGGLSLGNNSQKQDNNIYNSNGNYFRFDPEIIGNMPVNNGWRNLFVKGGGYFGSNKYEIKSGGTTTTYKSSTNGYNVGIGYNAFFAEETALRTCIYYRSITNKEKDSGDKTTQKGLAVSVGIVHSFRNF